MSKLITGAAAAAILMLPPFGAARADEFTEVIEEVLELYQEGDIGEAKSALEYAEQLLDQMKTAALEAFFPAPMAGWEAEEFQGEMAGAMAFGGGISTGRVYRKDDQVVEISLLGDSPMIQQFGMLLNNAAMIESSGGRMIRIKRQNAVITDENEIQMMVANRFLITIAGTADEETKIAYAKEFDLRGLARAP
jgi:hypothetical protein